LDADSVTIEKGGTLSVALTGTVPFGVLQGGFDLAFPVGGGSNALVFDGTTTQLPSKQVRIKADDLDLQQGGIVDVSGGGDLLAYEFVPGPGGTKDVLSAQVRPDLFAIVPTSSLKYASFDPLASKGSTL